MRLSKSPGFRASASSNVTVSTSTFLVVSPESTRMGLLPGTLLTSSALRPGQRKPLAWLGLGLGLSGLGLGLLGLGLRLGLGLGLGLVNAAL